MLLLYRHTTDIKGKYSRVFIDNVPIVLLFGVLAVWHGASQRDFMFALVSATLTIVSRYIHLNRTIQTLIDRYNYLYKQLIFSLFGLSLLIYSNADIPVIKSVSQLRPMSPYSSILQLSGILVVALVLYSYYVYKSHYEPYKGASEYYTTKLEPEGIASLSHHYLVFCMIELILLIALSLIGIGPNPATDRIFMYYGA